MTAKPLSPGASTDSQKECWEGDQSAQKHRGGILVLQGKTTNGVTQCLGFSLITSELQVR